MRTEAAPEAPEDGAVTRSSKMSWRQRRRERRTAGGRFRDNFVPKSIIGIVALLLAASIGFAFGGTILYAYYQYRLDKLDTKLTKFTSQFDDRAKAALKDIDKERDAAKKQVRDEIEPIKELRASGQTLKSLIDQVKDSVWFVQTQNDFGQTQVGSAFVVTSDAEKSYLLTSLSVVRSATKKPGPAIVLRRGDEQVNATLWTWQEERDLALLIVDKGSLPRIKWVPQSDAPEFGERVFVVAGIGGAGGSITQGFVADVSASGIQHDAAVTGAFAGGPLLNSKGEVLGTGSPAYAPLGFTSDRVTFAPLIRTACEKVLKCPEGAADAGGAGVRR